MDKKLVLATLGLAEDTSDAVMLAKLTELQNNQARLASDAQALATENERLKNAANEARVKSLVNAAVADGKITAAQAPTWEGLATKEYDQTKLALDSMQGYKNPNQGILAGGGTTGGTVADLADADQYRKLDREGGLLKLSRENPAEFDRLYAAFVADLGARGRVKRS